MALNASTTLPYDVAAVTAVFTDEAFLRHTSERVHGELKSLQLDGNTAGPFTLTAVRTMPTDKLPDFAKRFTGAFLTVKQTEKWDAPEADGSRQATVEISVDGVPVNVNAMQRLASEGTGTRVDLEGKVTSAIPFLGGKIADAAEPMIGKALNMQASEARKWLENH